MGRGIKNICAVIVAVIFVRLVVLAVSAPVGATSQWGIVITPCAWCGTTNGTIEVHHITPQHIAPDKKYDTNNMVCLDRECHFILGHRKNWTNAVTNLIEMIETGKK